MTGRQIDLVQQSFQEVMRISVRSARLFYQCRFELEPSLRPMFRGEDRSRRLMQTIDVAAVGSLGEKEARSVPSRNPRGSGADAIARR
jgi:hypothetical protein